MSEYKQKVDCSYCGNKNTVNVITKQTKYSRSIKVIRCKICKEQNGIKAILNHKL